MYLMAASPFFPKSYIHMVIVLANLNTSYDDSGPDERLSLKEALRSPY